VELLVSLSVLILMVGLLAQALASAQLGLGNLRNSAQRRQDAGTVLANIAKDLRASLTPMNRSFEGADALSGQFQFLINPPGVPLTASSSTALANPNTIFWSAAVSNSVGATGLVGYVVRWGTTPSGAPQPLLCRMFLNTAQAAPQLAQLQAATPTTQWANTSLVSTYAPADLNDGYQGWVADNVLALYVRALDPTMTPITQYARKVTGMSALQYYQGGLYTVLGATAGASSISGNLVQYDSRQGYQYTSSGNTIDMYGPSLPAAIEIVIVAAEPKDIGRLPTTLPASVFASTTYNANSDMWVNVTNYMAGLPSSLKKSARAYSTIVVP
jgi:hypothetical protein